MDFIQIAAQLFSDDDVACLAALAALAAQSAQIPLSHDILRGLLHCLEHKRKVVQRGAATQLVRFAPAQPEIVSALVEKLTDADPRLCWTAAFTLSHLNLPEPLPLPVLVENLGHEESDLRWAAATALLRLAEQHARVPLELLRLARTGNAVQRRMALYCLRDLAQISADARAVYLASLSDPDAMVRLSGLSCLGKLRLASAEVRMRLLELLENDPGMGVRRSTAVTLGQIGDAAPEVIEALRKAAQSNDVGLSKAATGALAKLQAEIHSPEEKG
jgi:HEAT repeat protein